MIDLILPKRADYTKSIPDSKVWFITGTRTFCNGYTKMNNTNPIYRAVKERGVYCEVLKGQQNRFPTNVLFGEALDIYDRYPNELRNRNKKEIVND